jgi:flagellar hook assembly protein FlgD
MILKTTSGGGAGVLIGKSHQSPVKATQTVLNNFPNPFLHDSTWIPFHLKARTNVKVRIYDLLGKLVREFDLGSLDVDRKADQYHTVLWDGRDEENIEAASGTYFYQIITDYDVTAGKMVLLRCPQCPYNYPAKY